MDGILLFGWVPFFYQLTTMIYHALMKSSRWLISAMIVFLVAACSPKRDVYVCLSTQDSDLPGLELLYSYDGYHWQAVDSSLNVPVLGDGTLTDPSITQGTDGVYRLLWVASKDGREGIGYSSSKDLLEWSEPTFITMALPDSVLLNVSTPRLIYDEQARSYLVYWISDRQGDKQVYGFTTQEFLSFSMARTVFDPEIDVQDPYIICRTSKDYVLIVRDETPSESSLKVAFSTYPAGPYDRTSLSFTSFQTGKPSVVKIGAKWLVYHQKETDGKTFAVTTLDFDSFETISDEISVPESHGCGTIFYVKPALFRKLFRKLHCKPVKATT